MTSTIQTSLYFVVLNTNALVKNKRANLQTCNPAGEENRNYSLPSQDL
jgi:hypothetical protein